MLFCNITINILYVKKVKVAWAVRVRKKHCNKRRNDNFA